MKQTLIFLLTPPNPNPTGILLLSFSSLLPTSLPIGFLMALLVPWPWKWSTKLLPHPTSTATATTVFKKPPKWWKHHHRRLKNCPRASIYAKPKRTPTAPLQISRNSYWGGRPCAWRAMEASARGLTCIQEWRRSPIFFWCLRRSAIYVPEGDVHVPTTPLRRWRVVSRASQKGVFRVLLVTVA